MGGHRVGQGAQHRMVWAGARFDRIEPAPVGVEPREPFSVRQLAFVGEIVGRAGEVVEGLHGTPEAGGEQPRRDGKILGVLDRQGEWEALEFAGLYRRAPQVSPAGESPLSRL